MDEKYFISGMKTVIVVPIDGVNLKDENELMKINSRVEKRVKDIIDGLRSSHEKFVDPDFGPNSEDPDGAKSLYGNIAPPPAGSKYPPPESLRWERPQYDDSNFDVDIVDSDESQSESDGDSEGTISDDEYMFESSHHEHKGFCHHGRLFIDGSSSGDVIQGQLGDCWFLGALSVMGANEALLRDCFWKGNSFQIHGLFVVRFFKDCSMVFIIIDDRLPVRRKDGRLVFASAKDPNELWVPLIEKAYAKLFGCYKALIGGYSHIALGDMTGFSPRLIVLKPGYVGYSESYSEDQIWKLLCQYKSWKCLMGCSIQSNPKQNAKVEAEAGGGLYYGHAYSLLDLNEVILDNNPTRLIKLRNPWGRGEWEGAFGDRSEEREKYDKELKKAFTPPVSDESHEEIEVNFNDGTFFMPFHEWYLRFTSLFAAVQFPDSWSGQQTKGSFSSEVGGNRDMGTWISNTKVKFRIESIPENMNQSQESENLTEVFLGIYINDSRMKLGYDYYKDPLYSTPLAFDIVSENEISIADPKKRQIVPYSSVPNYLLEDSSAKDVNNNARQPPYNFGTIQLEIKLRPNTDYYIVPSLYKRNQPGNYYLTVYANCKKFYLEGGISLSADQQKPMVIGGNATSTSKSKISSSSLSITNPKVVLKLSIAQFYEKKELLRERMIEECRRLRLSLGQVTGIFTDQPELPRAMFKRRMMDLGFNLADFPDDDLVVLDEDNNGTISSGELESFLSTGLKFVEGSDIPPPPPPPKDDLLFKASDLEGVLSVSVASARGLRSASNWFSSKSEELSGVVRNVFKYDAVAASQYYEKLTNHVADVQKAKDISSRLSSLDGKVPETNDRSPRAGGNGINLDLDLLKSPSKADATTKDEDNRSIRSSAQFVERAQRIGMEAAVKIHSDTLFQKAEVHRTSQILALKKSIQAQQSREKVDKLEEEKPLFRRDLANIRSKVRLNILDDEETMEFLGYAPSIASVAIVSPVNVLTTTNPNPTVTPSAANNDSNGVSQTNEAEEKKGQGLAIITTTLPTPSDQSVALNLSSSSSSSSSHERRSIVDFWDHLLDRVWIVVSSRSKQFHKSEKFKLFYGLKNSSALNYPDELLRKEKQASLASASSVGKPTKIGSSGLNSVPKSVSRVASRNKKPGEPLRHEEVINRLKKVEECSNEKYEEVFRRLISVPAVKQNELEGNRNASLHPTSAVNRSVRSAGEPSDIYVHNLFRRFDRNNNGVISMDEFRHTIQEFNIDISEEDCETLFNRFETREQDGVIDSQEFSDFFELFVKNDQNRDFVEHGSNFVPMNDLIERIGRSLRPLLSDMMRLKVSSPEQLLKIRASDSMASARVDDPISNTFSIPDNAILSHMSLAAASSNVKRLKFLKIDLTIEEMERVSRVCDFSVANFMNLFLATKSNYKNAMNWTGTTLMQALEVRCGVKDGLGISVSNSMKLWSGITTDINNVVPLSKVSEFFTGLIEDVLHSGVTSAPQHSCLDLEDPSHLPHGFDIPLMSPRLEGSNFPVNHSATWVKNKKLVSTPLSSWRQSFFGSTLRLPNNLDEPSSPVPPSRPSPNCCILMNIRIDTLCRILADDVIHSVWNRSIAGNIKVTNDSEGISKTSDNSNLSFSGFQAFLRYNHINALERKLKYIYELERNQCLDHVFLLLHVYFRASSQEVLVLGYDPMNGELYRYEFKETISHFPLKEKLTAMFVHQAKYKEFADRCLSLKWDVFNPLSCRLYNPWDTPIEDAALESLAQRLRVVRSPFPNRSQLVLAEDPHFINQLKLLLDASSKLPYFSVLNDLSLTFEVDSEKLKKSSSASSVTIEKVVFGAIRRQPSLYKFLTSVMSSLYVVLSSYNAGIRILMNWSEMLAYISDYRSPFISVSLLPAFLEPSEYFYQPKDAPTAFDGDERDAKEGTTLFRGPVDVDGGRFPIWNANFDIPFKPPRLTSCKILSTEVAKLKIEGRLKYALVMVREGKISTDANKSNNNDNQNQTNRGSFFFLTIYDPRTSTDYQCGLDKECNLYHTLTSPSYSQWNEVSNSATKNKLSSVESASALQDFLGKVSQQLLEAVEDQKLIVGPAVTPRLMIHVYNQRGKEEELLGSCQLSISSVLSGTGVTYPFWSKLTYEVERNSDGHGSLINAGEIRVDLSFRKLGEIAMEAASEKNYLVTLKREKQLRKVFKPSGSTEAIRRMSLSSSTCFSANPDVISTRLEGQLKIKDDKIQNLKQTIHKLQSALSMSEEKENDTSTDKVENNQLVDKDKEKEVLLSRKEVEVQELQRRNESLFEERQALLDEISTLKTTLAKNSSSKDKDDNEDESNNKEEEEEEDKNENENDEGNRSKSKKDNATIVDTLQKEIEDLRTQLSQKEHESVDSTSPFQSLSSLEVWNTLCSQWVKRFELKKQSLGQMVGHPLDPWIRSLLIYLPHPDVDEVTREYFIASLLDINVDIPTQAVDFLMNEIENASLEPFLVPVMNYIANNLLVSVSSPVYASIPWNLHIATKSNDTPIVDSSSKGSKSMQSIDSPMSSAAGVGSENSTDIKMPTPIPPSNSSKKISTSHSNENHSNSNSTANNTKRPQSARYGRGTDSKHSSSGNSGSSSSTSSNNNNKNPSQGSVSAARPLSATTPAKEISMGISNSLPSSTIAADAGSSSIDWNNVPLPKNWERRYDARRQKNYYVDHNTRTTQWKHPSDLSSSQDNPAGVGLSKTAWS